VAVGVALKAASSSESAAASRDDAVARPSPGGLSAARAVPAATGAAEDPVSSPAIATASPRTAESVAVAGSAAVLLPGGNALADALADAFADSVADGVADGVANAFVGAVVGAVTGAVAAPGLAAGVPSGLNAGAIAGEFTISGPSVAGAVDAAVWVASARPGPCCAIASALACVDGGSPCRVSSGVGAAGPAADVSSRASQTFLEQAARRDELSSPVRVDRCAAGLRASSGAGDGLACGRIAVVGGALVDGALDTATGALDGEGAAVPGATAPGGASERGAVAVSFDRWRSSMRENSVGPQLATCAGPSPIRPGLDPTCGAGARSALPAFAEN
jgi:hypothetical protein